MEAARNGETVISRDLPKTNRVFMLHHDDFIAAGFAEAGERAPTRVWLGCYEVLRNTRDTITLKHEQGELNCEKREDGTILWQGARVVLLDARGV